LGWLAVGYQAARCRHIESLAAAVESEARDVRLQQSRFAQSRELLDNYQRIAAALNDARLADLAKRLTQCLPDDVWLESVSLEHPGRLVLSGGSYSEDGVFEFAKHLATVPQLANVAVDGTRPVQFPSGSGMHFDVHGEIADDAQQEDPTDDRG
jgi:Tfp pilus assembly protein PilN